MDIAYDFAQYLDDAGFGTLGTDIFVDQMLSDQNGVYVVHAGGSLNLYNPIQRVTLDVYVKNSSASAAITTLTNIRNHIHRMYDTATSNGQIYSILIIGDVENMDRDLQYEKIYKITVSLLVRELGIS